MPLPQYKETGVVAGGKIALPLQADFTGLQNIRADEAAKAKAESAKNASRQKANDDYYKWMIEKTPEIHARNKDELNNMYSDLIGLAEKRTGEGVRLLSDPEVMEATGNYHNAAKHSGQQAQELEDIDAMKMGDYINNSYRTRLYESAANTKLNDWGDYQRGGIQPEDFNSVGYVGDIVKDLKASKQTGSYIDDDWSELGDMIITTTNTTNITDEALPKLADLALKSNPDYAMTKQMEADEAILAAANDRKKTVGKWKDVDIDDIVQAIRVEEHDNGLMGDEKYLLDAAMADMDAFRTQSKVTTTKAGLRTPTGKITDEDIMLRKQVVQDTQVGMPYAIEELSQGTWNKQNISSAEFDASGEEGMIVLHLTDSKGEPIQGGEVRIKASNFAAINKIRNSIKGEAAIGTDLMQKVPEAKKPETTIEITPQLNKDVDTIQKDPAKGAELLLAAGAEKVEYSLTGDDELKFTYGSTKYTIDLEAKGEAGKKQYEKIKEVLMKADKEKYQKRTNKYGI